MKDQLKLLVDLQTIDLDIDRNEQAMQDIRSQVEGHENIQSKLIADLDNQRVELKETIALKAQREEELREAEERSARSKERLMNVSSTKEYNALEKEIEQLRRKAEETREQLDHIRDAIELRETAIVEKEEKISQLKQEIKAANKEADERMKKLGKQLSDIQKHRNRARETVKRGILRRYDFIRQRRGGTAITSATDGACTGCFMRLPPQQYIELQRGNTLVSCPSCQRILYFPAHFEEVPEA